MTENSTPRDITNHRPPANGHDRPTRPPAVRPPDFPSDSVAGSESSDFTAPGSGPLVMPTNSESSGGVSDIFGIAMRGGSESGEGSPLVILPSDDTFGSPEFAGLRNQSGFHPTNIPATIKPPGTPGTVPAPPAAPSSDAVAIPLAEPTAAPSAEAIRIPSAEAIRLPSGEAIRIPSAEAIRLPSGEAIRIPSADAIELPAAEPPVKPESAEAIPLDAGAGLSGLAGNGGGGGGASAGEAPPIPARAPAPTKRRPAVFEALGARKLAEHQAKQAASAGSTQDADDFAASDDPAGFSPPSDFASDEALDGVPAHAGIDFPEPVGAWAAVKAALLMLAQRPFAMLGTVAVIGCLAALWAGTLMVCAVSITFFAEHFFGEKASTNLWGQPWGSEWPLVMAGVAAAVIGIPIVAYPLAWGIVAVNTRLLWLVDPARVQPLTRREHFRQIGSAMGRALQGFRAHLGILAMVPIVYVAAAAGGWFSALPTYLGTRNEILAVTVGVGVGLAIAAFMLAEVLAWGFVIVEWPRRWGFALPLMWRRLLRQGRRRVQWLCVQLFAIVLVWLVAGLNVAVVDALRPRGDAVAFAFVAANVVLLGIVFTPVLIAGAWIARHERWRMQAGGFRARAVLAADADMAITSPTMGGSASPDGIPSEWRDGIDTGPRPRLFLRLSILLFAPLLIGLLGLAASYYVYWWPAPVDRPYFEQLRAQYVAPFATDEPNALAWVSGVRVDPAAANVPNLRTTDLAWHAWVRSTDRATIATARGFVAATPGIERPFADARAIDRAAVPHSAGNRHWQPPSAALRVRAMASANSLGEFQTFTGDTAKIVRGLTHGGTQDQYDSAIATARLLAEAFAAHFRCVRDGVSADTLAAHFAILDGELAATQRGLGSPEVAAIVDKIGLYEQGYRSYGFDVVDSLDARARWTREMHLAKNYCTELTARIPLSNFEARTRPAPVPPAYTGVDEIRFRRHLWSYAAGSTTAYDTTVSPLALRELHTHIRLLRLALRIELARARSADGAWPASLDAVDMNPWPAPGGTPFSPADDWADGENYKYEPVTAALEWPASDEFSERLDYLAALELAKVKLNFTIDRAKSLRKAIEDFLAAYQTAAANLPAPAPIGTDAGTDGGANDRAEPMVAPPPNRFSLSNYPAQTGQIMVFPKVWTNATAAEILDWLCARGDLLVVMRSPTEAAIMAQSESYGGGTFFSAWPQGSPVAVGYRIGSIGHDGSWKWLGPPAAPAPNGQPWAAQPAVYIEPAYPRRVLGNSRPASPWLDPANVTMWFSDR